ncbi:hypothetical protein GH714_001597 [Hevea brasiliensis]|uniref:Aminotransferase class I/classII large domain-containing protein n=1 Tax=Hevea brasiliensis TaxID=3981 RepID=A0A6A6L5N3_HEVBR|nr:hypothetical protein GH714_001597 [Hevea brasiliensis]
MVQSLLKKQLLAIRNAKNQYALGCGVPDFNSAIAARFKKDTGLVLDPDKEVTVTSGCTEAIAATMLGLINPGDEVILFAPFYDSYEATLSVAGAKIKCITLQPPDFAVPIDELKSTISKNTLYYKLAFEMDHISMASPGMYERTWAAAVALRAPDSYYVELKRDYMEKKAILAEGLKVLGFKVFPSSGTYFVIVDHTPFGMEIDIAFCEYLIKEVGALAIPTNVFYLNPEDEMERICPIKHIDLQNIMSWRIHEGYMSYQFHSSMSGLLASRIILPVASIGLETFWLGAIVALVNLCIGIAKLYGNVAL